MGHRRLSTRIRTRQEFGEGSTLQKKRATTHRHFTLVMFFFCFFLGGEGKNVYIISRKMYHFDEYILVMDFPKSSTTLSFLEGATHTFCSFWYGTIDLVLEFFTATSVVELGFFKDAEIQHLGCVKRTEKKCKLRA